MTDEYTLDARNGWQLEKYSGSWEVESPTYQRDRTGAGWDAAQDERVVAIHVSHPGNPVGPTTNTVGFSVAVPQPDGKTHWTDYWLSIRQDGEAIRVRAWREGVKVSKGEEIVIENPNPRWFRDDAAATPME